MIPLTHMKGQTVALFGLGASGLATARALAAGGAHPVVHDDDPDRVAQAVREGFEKGDLRTIAWDRFCALVLSPGVPLTHPRPHWTVDLARAAGVAVIGDIELFARERRALASHAPFIAVTGTNGKSTTTALIAHIIASAGRKVAMGGNIGQPVLALAPFDHATVYVVECSSFQIDLAPTLDPSCGILLNISPDHLDRHGKMRHYAEIKERLVAGSLTAIVAVDDAWCEAIAERLERAGGHVVRISRQKPIDAGFHAMGTRIACRNHEGSRVVVDLAGIETLRGDHNAQNAAAAIAACTTIGLDEREIVAGLHSFRGLSHRMQPIGRLGHVSFINDSKATNADAAATALATYERIYWIVGGLAKQGGIAALSPFFKRIARAYLIGEAAPAYAATLGDAVPFEIAGSLERAVARAAEDAAADDSHPEAVVLLSPASASFDQFRNFEARGNRFAALVEELIARAPAITDGPRSVEETLSLGKE